VAFLDAIGRSPRVTLVAVGQEQEARGLRWLRRHDERIYSFVDATSFAVMRAQRVTRALAFGGDFSAAGFEELRP
jgi:predicted nucleic acid-binding protein